ncbi:MAG: M23 family metallopeptidase [Ruminococcaceae bacterium]|nr:M23 family metallopeptidase [Oscillospiraceae bacterium]
MKKTLLSLSVLAVVAMALLIGDLITDRLMNNTLPASADHIKWVDFSVPKSALDDALSLDVATYGTDRHIKMYESLAFIAAKNYGELGKYKKGTLLSLHKEKESLKEKLASGKLYDYYIEAYGAVLGGLTGKYTKVTQNSDGSISESEEYGLRAFSPIAAGYYYRDYDDFGASRSYGYKRSHLGHDLLGSVGTPIIAVESGIVEACGWNQYGGWRIGIRSFDGLRYYYYAHLRKDHPYCDIYEGKVVNAGEVIGYLGMTGYSSKENTNNIDIPHLHFGLELIFDKEQKDGYNQIWIDVYALSQFLYKNRSEVIYNKETKEYSAKTIYIYEEAPD